MTLFSSRPLRQSSINRVVKKHPSLFGIPFLLLMVAASYGLTPFTQTRYDLHDQNVKNVRLHLFIQYSFIFFNYSKMSKEQELNLDKNRKKFDIREEYFVAFGLRPLSLVFLYSLFAAVKCLSWWGLGTKAHSATQRSARMGCSSYRTSIEKALTFQPCCNILPYILLWRKSHNNLS